MGMALAVTREKVQQLLALEINPKQGTSVADEAEDLIDRGFSSLKAFLDKGGLDNEETKARIMKTITEAQEAKARTETQMELTEKQRIKNLANRLRLLIMAERAVTEQGMQDFLAALDDLGKDG
jgi:polyhydroxyalkanoate synthesis regulator phasin